MRAVIIFFCLFSTGCVVQKSDVGGIYEATGEDYLYRINLRSDSTFTLSERVQDGRPSCEGIWKLVARDSK